MIVLTFNEMKNIFETYRDIYACINFAAFKSVGESVENPQKYYQNNIGSTDFNKMFRNKC